MHQTAVRLFMLSAPSMSYSSLWWKFSYQSGHQTMRQRKGATFWRPWLMKVGGVVKREPNRWVSGTWNAEGPEQSTAQIPPIWPVDDFCFLDKPCPNVPVVVPYFSLERPHLCAPCDIPDVKIQPLPNADVRRPCRRQACVIIERDIRSLLDSSYSFIVGYKEKAAAWIFGGKIETVSPSRYTHTSQCFPLMCTSAWTLPCSPQLVQFSHQTIFQMVACICSKSVTTGKHGQDGSRTPPKHGVCLASMSQVIVHSCAGFTINLAKFSRPAGEKKRRNGSASCHRRLKDPISDVCRSKSSHQQSLVLVDKLNVEFSEGESSLNQTWASSLNFIGVLHQLLYLLSRRWAIEILVNFSKLLYPLSLPDQALVIGGLARESFIEYDLRRLIDSPWFRCATCQAATWSRPVSAIATSCQSLRWTRRPNFGSAKRPRQVNRCLQPRLDSNSKVAALMAPSRN